MAGLGAVVGLSGCATLEGGLDDEVAVISDPPGAAVTTTAGATFAATPCTLTVGRSAVISVTAAKPGYVTQTATAEAEADDAAVAEVSRIEATPDAVGRAIDVQDGALYRHVPQGLVTGLDRAP